MMYNVAQSRGRDMSQNKLAKLYTELLSEDWKCDHCLSLESNYRDSIIYGHAVLCYVFLIVLKKNGGLRHSELP